MSKIEENLQRKTAEAISYINKRTETTSELVGVTLGTAARLIEALEGSASHEEADAETRKSSAFWLGACANLFNELQEYALAAQKRVREKDE